MKTYVKPKLMVLSISASDALCACGTKTRGDYYWSMKDPTPDDGAFTWQDAQDIGAFGESEGQCTTKYEGYCKFTSTYDSSVFTS